MQRKPKELRDGGERQSSEANISAARRDDPPVSTPSAAEKPDQIDMMSEDELRTELRKLVTQITEWKRAHKAVSDLADGAIRRRQEVERQLLREKWLIEVKEIIERYNDGDERPAVAALSDIEAILWKP